MRNVVFSLAIFFPHFLASMSVYFAVLTIGLEAYAATINDSKRLISENEIFLMHLYELFLKPVAEIGIKYSINFVNDKFFAALLGIGFNSFLVTSFIVLTINSLIYIFKNVRHNVA